MEQLISSNPMIVSCNFAWDKQTQMQVTSNNYTCNTCTDAHTHTHTEVNQSEEEETLKHRQNWVNYFLRFGRSLLTQRRRQDLPVLWRRPLDRMELQSLGPYLFTCLSSTSSSSAFHGPFLICSTCSFFPCIFPLTQKQKKVKLLCCFLPFKCFTSLFSPLIHCFTHTHTRRLFRFHVP